MNNHTCVANIVRRTDAALKRLPRDFWAEIGERFCGAEGVAQGIGFDGDRGPVSDCLFSLSVSLV